MLETSCHCGAVRLRAAHKPTEANDCNCSICRRYAALWAYYQPKDVTLPDLVLTEIYVWNDRMVEFHRCKICGCVTHWTPADKAVPRMGINLRLADPAALAGVRIRPFDGANSWKYLDE